MTTQPMTEPDAASQFERNLPEPILRKLQAIQRRIRRVLLLRGLLAVAASALAMLLLLMAVDAAVVMTTLPPRLALTGGGLAAIVAAWCWFVVRPLRRRISLAAIARVIETQHPELEERIISTVELRDQAGADGRDVQLPRGSEELIAALVEEATLDAGRIEPRKEVSTRSIKPYLLVAAGLAGVLGLIFLLWPRHAGMALVRVVAPVLNLGNLSAMDLEVKPGDRVVVVGDAVTIEAAAPGLSGAELEIIDTTGYATRQKAQPAPAADGRQTASWTFPAVMSGFQYRVRVGRALSEYYRITAVERPKIEAVEVRLDYPGYTSLPPQTVKELPKVIEAVAGTQATLTVTAKGPVSKPQLAVAGNPVPDPVTSTEPSGTRPTYAWTFALQPSSAGPGRLVLEEEHGIACEPAEFEVRVVADNPPSITVVEPTAPKLTMRPRDRLTIKYQAEDDFGLGQIEMTVRLDGGEPKSTSQPFPADAPKPFRACQGEVVLDLGQIDLGEAKQVTVEMRAADTLPESRQGPHWATSKPLVIEIDRSRPESLAQQDPLPGVEGAKEEPKPEARPGEKEEPNEQETARQQAEELKALAEQQKQLAEQAAAKTPDQALDPQWKADQQKVAGELADQVAADPKAMQAELKADQQQATELARDAQKLADQQQWLRQETQALAGQVSNPSPVGQVSNLSPEAQANREKLKQEILQHLAEEQKALAAEAARLEDQAKGQDPAAAKELAAAREEMNQSAQEMGRQQPGEAAQDARDAQKRLEAAAAEEQKPQESGGPSPEQQSRGEKAQDLARAEQNLAQALDAVQKGDFQQALAEMQQGVRQEAQGLQQEAQEMALRAASLGMDKPARDDVRKASEQLSEAAQGATEAKEALAKGPAEAGPPQEKTQQALGQAAQSLRELGQELGRELAEQAGPSEPLPQPGGPHSPQPDAGRQSLVAAMQEAMEAAQASDARQAEQSARKAAQALDQAARSAAQRAAGQDPQTAARQGRPPQGQASKSQGRATDQPGPPGGQGGKKVAKSSPQPAGKMTVVEVKGKGDADWAKFRGQIKGEAHEAAAKDADDEYRDLVNRYFEELSRQGTQGGGQGR